jgi:hypothetical protein
MTKLALLSAGMIAAAIVATPAMAREGHVNSRYVAQDSVVAPVTPYAGGYAYAGGYVCHPAPRVGAFATAPWTSETPCYPGPAY